MPPYALPPTQVPFLDRIVAAKRDSLLALGVTRSLPDGRRIFVEGSEDTHVEILRRGYAKVTTSVGGRGQLLAIRSPGDLLGEFAAVTNKGRSATVTACGEVVSTIVSGPAFLAFLSQHPDVARELTATVSQRLAWANARRSDFTTYPVQARLARMLADIAVLCGEPVEDGLRIGVELTQPELASLVGAAEDTVQKALRNLRQAGLVRSGYRRIVVCDPGRLLSLATHDTAG